MDEMYDFSVNTTRLLEALGIDDDGDTKTDRFTVILALARAWKAGRDYGLRLAELRAAYDQIDGGE